MAIQFPDTNVPPSKRTLKWGQDMIDAAINIHESSNASRRQIMQRQYDGFNGIRPSTAKKFITEKYGKALSQQFIDYHLGRTKVKVLLGEALKINLNPRVKTINPKAVTRKLNETHRRIGILLAQEQTRAINKQLGFALPVIPDSQVNTFINMAPKEVNELNMQRIINKKMSTERMLAKAYHFLTDMILTSECHAKIERDPYGNDTLRIISPMNAIFQEIPGDEFIQGSPFKGEVRRMYLHDIISTFPDLSETDQKRIKEALNNEDALNGIGASKTYGMPAIDVYTIQWKTQRIYYEKVSADKKTNTPYIISLSENYYEQNQKEITKEEEREKYSINRFYGEDLYEITRIGKDIYAGFGRVKGQIQRRGPNGKYKAYYDYINLLFGTVNGSRIPLQEIIDNLSEVYNVVMFMINRELKKMKGMVFTYDKSATPKGEDMMSVLYKLTEHGIMIMASSEDQNISGRDIDNLDRLIRTYDLSVSQGFKILLDIKMQVEYTMDRITGINEDRSGLGKASQTATGSMNNIEASRSITQDLFYFWTQYINEILTMLAEKTKTNWEFLDSDMGEMLLGTAGIGYAKATRDLTDDDYSVMITDGKLELEIKERARMYMQSDINSQQLRTKDAIRFELADTLAEGLAILDGAWKEITAVANQRYQTEQEMNAQNNETQIQLARENREDLQANEKDNILLKEEEKRKTKAMELGVKSAVESDKISAAKSNNQ